MDRDNLHRDRFGHVLGKHRRRWRDFNANRRNERWCEREREQDDEARSEPQMPDRGTTVSRESDGEQRQQERRRGLDDEPGHDFVLSSAANLIGRWSLQPIDDDDIDCAALVVQHQAELLLQRGVETRRVRIRGGRRDGWQRMPPGSRYMPGSDANLSVKS